MPEGDTVWLAAQRLHAALSDQVLLAADLRVPQLAETDLSGRRVLAVVARGKHLLTRIEGGLSLHTHFRMDGSWHLYRPGDRWSGGPDYRQRGAGPGAPGAPVVLVPALPARPRALAGASAPRPSGRPHPLPAVSSGPAGPGGGHLRGGCHTAQHRQEPDVTGNPRHRTPPAPVRGRRRAVSAARADRPPGRAAGR